MRQRKTINILGIRITYNTQKGVYRYRVFAKILEILYYVFLKRFKKNYDEIVSLGYNCESSFRIRNIVPDIKHYIYTWSFIHNRSGFLETLSNLSTFYSFTDYKVQPSGMYTNTRYNMSFYPRNEKEQFDDNGDLKNEIYVECKDELNSRIKHLAQKTEELFQSNKKTLFVLKVDKTNLEDDKTFIQNVFQIVEKQYLSGKFKLDVFVQDKDFSKDELDALKIIEQDKLKIINVKEFSEPSRADRSGDIMGWIWKLFKEIYM